MTGSRRLLVGLHQQHPHFPEALPRADSELRAEVPEEGPRTAPCLNDLAGGIPPREVDEDYLEYGVKKPIIPRGPQDR